MLVRSNPHVRKIGVLAAAALVLVPACGGAGERSTSHQITGSAHERVQPQLSVQDAASASEPLEDVFVAVNGFEFEDVSPRVERTQLEPIRASVVGVGHVTDSNVKIAVKGGEIGVTVTVAAIEHTASSTPQDVFGALLGSVSLRGRPRRAVRGQAFRIDTADADILVSPLAVEPYLVVLVAIAPSNAPGDAVIRGLLRKASAS